MNDGMKAHVIDLLKSCPERRRKIALLHYELEHSAYVSEEEMISAMALGHGGETDGRSEGHISDKTLYIALNYQSMADRANADTKEEIAMQLVELEQEQNRLDYYISLLDERQMRVLNLLCVRQYPQGEVEKMMGLSAKTVRKLKNNALDTLTGMYEFVADLS